MCLVYRAADHAGDTRSCAGQVFSYDPGSAAPGRTCCLRVFAGVTV